jgi:hypothetical protein
MPEKILIKTRTVIQPDLALHTGLAGQVQGYPAGFRRCIQVQLDSLRDMQPDFCIAYWPSWTGLGICSRILALYTGLAG